MAIILGADLAGKELKSIIKNYLVENNYEVVDVSGNSASDFIETTLAVAREVKKDDDNLGIVIDAYGAGRFMVATKITGMIAAQVSDERSAYMTRGHNNARMITMGSEVSSEMTQDFLFMSVLLIKITPQKDEYVISHHTTMSRWQRKELKMII